MFERFTEQSVRVIMHAQDESRRLRHSYVGSEELLLGLLSLRTVATRSLNELGVDLKSVRIEVEKIVGFKAGFEKAECSFTKECRRVLELSWDEAKRLSHSHVGPDHLFLGLLREQEDGSIGVATSILMNFGIDIDKLRSKIENALVSGINDPPPPSLRVEDRALAPADRGAELSWEEKNYYQILQVDPNAETALISKIYDYLSEKYRPDKLNTGDEMKYEMINNAWLVLSDETKRVEYDATLKPNNMETS